MKGLFNPRLWVNWCGALAIVCLIMAFVAALDGDWHAVVAMLTYAGINITLIWYWKKQ